MEKKKFFKSKTQMVIYLILFCVCIFLFVLIGKTTAKKDDFSESYRFSKLYDKVPEDNFYTFVNASTVLDIINSKSGIILMGFPSNKWVNEYASILNKAVKESNVSKIYYYDFKSDRDTTNGTYETIVNKLTNYLVVDDEGIQDIQAPTVLMIKNGKLIGYFDEITYMRGNVNPESYYTNNKKDTIYDNFKSVLEYYNE